MRVIFFRHGPAGQRDAARWPDDGLRPLTPKGIRRTRLAAAGLRRLEPGIELIVTSPLTRAVETAELLKEQFAGVEIETLDLLAPGASLRRLVESVAAHNAHPTVALVGHEPDLGKLVGMLLFSAPSPIALKKAGACSIEFSAEVRPGAGQLLWFLPPRVLRRLAGKKAHA
jgi:phosphohistidine phosphatase